MDIYGLFDLIAIILGLSTAIYLKTYESILLAAFFIATSISSLILFQTEYYYYFDYVFVFLSMVFGLSSKKHPVILGYIGYLVLVGLNTVHDVMFYSAYVYAIYIYQLWVVRYAKVHSRIGCIWRNNISSSRHHKHKEKAI